MLDLLGEWFGDRAFFQRYFDHDPAFRDDLCLVAEDGGRIVSTLQIFPKTICAGSARLYLGGIGNVFTTPACRGRGFASALLERALGMLEREGFDLSLLFATRLAFYGRFGWGSVRRLLGAVTLGAPQPPLRHAIRPFNVDRDLEAVMAIYDAYSLARPGAVVRDREYWLGQLRYAGNPGEYFLVAERGGKPVAYARMTNLYDVDTVMEHGYVAGSRDALLDIFAVLAGLARNADFFVFHLGAEPELADELGARGYSVREVEDVFSMWRVIAPESVAAKLGVPVDAVLGSDFFERLLPFRRSVYWTSDRF